MITLQYIGDDFYFESGTSMSSIYEKTSDGYARWDWGKLQFALKEGESITIRPADSDTMRWAYKNLKEIQKRLESHVF